MEGKNAESFNYRNYLDPSENFSSAQDRQSIPSFSNSTSTSSYPFLALGDTLSDPFNEIYLSSVDFPFFSETHSSTYSAPLQPATFFDPIAVDNFPQQLPNARRQHFTAQGAGPSQLLETQQAQDTFWSPFNMNNISAEHEESAQAAELAFPGENESLECTFQSFPEQDPLPAKSALRRHQDKHIHPYICTHTSCNRKIFGRKGDLERHTREVHGSQAYTCPVLFCKRHKRGFHRRSNLFEHQKRVHSFQSPTFLRAPSKNFEELSEGEGTTPRSQYETEADRANGGDVGETEEIITAVGLNSKEDLSMKLRDLRISRAELDEDIRIMERALRIMDGRAL